MKTFIKVGVACICTVLAFGSLPHYVSAEEKPFKTSAIVYHTPYTGPDYSEEGLYIINEDGTNKKQLFSGRVNSSEISPDGTKIVFSASDGSDSEIFTINVDGTGLTQITNNIYIQDDFPTWSGNGEQIAFIRDYNQIYTMNADGTGEKKIFTDVTGTPHSLHWSPVDDRILFSSDGSDSDVYVIHADGSGLTNLTQTDKTHYTQRQFDEGAASWSSDGQKIVFQDGNATVYTMNPDGTNRTVIKEMAGTAPHFSPDGSKIATSLYVSSAGGHLIRLMNADGTNEQFLTHSGTSFLDDYGEIVSTPQPGAQLTRLAGANRYEVSANIGKEISNLNIPSDTVVLARGDLYTDALSGGPLAAKSKSPILLTATSSLPTAIQDEIKRRQPSKAIILGGTGSVSTTVETQLKSLGVTNIERIDGPNRFAVSASVAEKVTAGGTTNTAIIASGLNFPDALSASSVAAQKGMPILLVGTSSIPDQIKAFINNHPEITNYVIVGGPATVFDTVKTQLEGMGKTVTRISGANRYAVGVNLIKHFNMSAQSIVFARGDVFADALSGGPLAAYTTSPILLTPSTKLATEVETFLQERSAEFEKGYILGGLGSVSADVEAKIASY